MRVQCGGRSTSIRGKRADWQKRPLQKRRLRKELCLEREW